MLRIMDSTDVYKYYVVDWHGTAIFCILNMGKPEQIPCHAIILCCQGSVGTVFSALTAVHLLIPEDTSDSFTTVTLLF